MMIDLLYNEMVWWLFGTAVVFTYAGKFMALSSRVEHIVGSTIDSLIEEGYLKTRGSGDNLVILKHSEWCKKDVDV